MKRYGFIYNPTSGRNTSQKRLIKLQKCATQLPHSQFRVSKNKQEIRALVKRMQLTHDTIVVCGGDGTIREVASVLIGSNTPLGIIPTGSGNDLAKSLNIPAQIEKAFKILARGKSVAIDTGRCNDFIFINTLGFGFDGLTNRYANEYRGTPSFLRYFFAAFKSNYKRKNMEVKIKLDGLDEHRKIIMATLANGKVEGGNFWIAPNALLADGKLNLVTIDPISRWVLPIYLPFVMLKRPHLIPHLKNVEVREVQLQFEDPVAIHADGEIIETDYCDFKISVVSQSLNVICNGLK